MAEALINDIICRGKILQMATSSAYKTERRYERKEAGNDGATKEAKPQNEAAKGDKAAESKNACNAVCHQAFVPTISPSHYLLFVKFPQNSHCLLCFKKKISH